jgi:hypothetical protein
LLNLPQIFDVAVSPLPTSPIDIPDQAPSDFNLPAQSLFNNLPKLSESPYIVEQPDGPYADSKKIPMCHLLRHPPQRLSEVSILNAAEIGITGHILVMTSTWHLFRFLCTVRSAHIPSQDLRPILFMGSHEPTVEEFHVLSVFPDVKYLMGNPRLRRDLVRANVSQADRIVILSEASTWGTDTNHKPSAVGDDFNDLQAILIHRLTEHTIVNEDNQTPAYTMVELADAEAIKYLASNEEVSNVPTSSTTPRFKSPRLRGVSNATELQVPGPISIGAHAKQGLPAGNANTESTTREAEAAIHYTPHTSTSDRILSANKKSFFGNVRRRVHRQLDFAKRKAHFPKFLKEIQHPLRIQGSERIRYDPLFASGEAFCANLLDHILIQHYFNPVVLDIFKLFSGVRSKNDIRLDEELKVNSSFLYTIDVPSDYVVCSSIFFDVRIAVRNSFLEY